jgi:hypothetical protein
MKRILLIALLAQFLVTGTASAGSTAIDFNVLGINAIDITLQNNPAGLTLNGVNFGYDNYGSTTDYAVCDSAGIYGTTYGPLIYNFNTPAMGLKFDFSLLGVPNDTQADFMMYALVAIYSNNGSFTDSGITPATYTPYDPNDLAQGGSGIGSLNYSGTVFNQAVLYFYSTGPTDLTGLPLFTVSNISYETAAPVPVPATLLLFGSGLLGLAGFRKKMKN